jgi:Zinc finger, C3HC4 type (RING finger)
MYTSSSGDAVTTGGSQYYSVDQVQQGGAVSTLAQLSSNGQLSKADSHAVLMELFARDQDLVRQATESARLKAESKQQQQQQQQETQAVSSSQQPSAPQPASSAPPSQHPMMKAPSGLLGVPSLNSWPHFSSITSLNNLGTIPGVKSITSLSGVDLASKGNVNKMGNIAQVKSMESIGNNDSYAFLELFFGDRSSTNLSGMGGIGGSSNRGMLSSKQHGEDDNEIGLSLEDESPSHTTRKEFLAQSSLNHNSSFGSSGTANVGHSPHDSGYLKRAYDDALAARGLISVSRSCEKLTDLELPVKIQRTLSQGLLNMEQEQQMRQQAQQQHYEETLGESYGMLSEKSSSHQYPGQQATEPNENEGEGTSSKSSNFQDEQVQVSSSIACALCSQTKIDTQLRPCGHMFHERCLKPNLTTYGDQPKCPIDDIPIHSAVLAVPDNNYGHQATQSTDAA